MRGFFDHMPAKTAFYTGLIGGVLVIGTLGFLVMLVSSLGGGVKLAKGNTLGTKNVAAAPTPSAAPEAPKAGKVKPASKDDHVLGDLKKAEVVLIEYSDLECPFCQRFHSTMQQTLDAFGDKVAWVYRHYPLSFHANAFKESEASECAAELGGNDAFWKYVDTIFERTTANGTGFALSNLAPLAKELGLNETKFQECLDSGKYADKVQKDLAEGTTAGVNGTPATFVIPKDGEAQLIPGALPFESVRQLVESVLN